MQARFVDLKILSRTFFLTLAFLATACTAITPVPPNSPAIVLENQQTVNFTSGFGTVTVPKGRYEAAFQTTEGTFYTAPNVLIVRTLAHHSHMGGVYLPHPRNSDQRQGIFNIDYAGEWLAVSPAFDYRYSTAP